MAVSAAAWFGGRWAVAEYHLACARRDLSERHAEEALGHLHAAERLWKDDPETAFLLARTNRRLGRFWEVGTALERAWKLGYPVESLEREQWLTLAQNGQMRRAEPHLAELLTEPGGDGAEICDAYVQGYLLTYRFEEAFGLLQAWQADFPDDPQPHLIRGLYFEHVLDSGKAIEEYRRGIALAPDRQDIRLRLAGLLVKEHDYEEAEDHLRTLLQQAAGDPAVRSAWGACLVAQGRTEEARTVLNALLEEHPDHAAARLEQGRLELEAGNAEEAVRRLGPLAERQPWDIETRYTLATAYQAAGDPEAAKPHFEFVTEGRPARTRARRLIEKVKTDPGDIESRYEIGTILLKYDSPGDGVGWLQSVLDLEPDHGPTHRALADYYAGTGDRERAERHRQLAGPQKAAVGETPQL